MSQERWTLKELYEQLRIWEAQLNTEGYPGTTIGTYIGRTEFFLRWLAGEWRPTGPRR